LEVEMAKTFYTEYDIEDMVKRGTQALHITEDTVLTDLAYEKATKLGLKLIRGQEKPPSAPERPYISKTPGITQRTSAKVPATTATQDIRQRVRDAVIARLGSDVDIKLLDSIIQRVLDNVGVK